LRARKIYNIAALKNFLCWSRAGAELTKGDDSLAQEIYEESYRRTFSSSFVALVSPSFREIVDGIVLHYGNKSEALNEVINR
jgi:hypothetical protein